MFSFILPAVKSFLATLTADSGQGKIDQDDIITINVMERLPTVRF